MVTLQMTGRDSMYFLTVTYRLVLNCVTARWLFKNKLKSNLNLFLLQCRENMAIST